VQELNGFLRGWAGYFRCGKSARHFAKIRIYTLSRIALFVAACQKRERGYGWGRVAYDSPDSLGLIALNGSVVAQGRTGPGGKSRMRRGEGCR
jgi:RNA-directed DNA polymerase